jgi:tRNA(fMet)-specific endonuclease VapC
VKYLLDTNAVIAILKRNQALLARLRQYLPPDFALSAIEAHEFYYRAYKGQRTAHSLALIVWVPFAVLEFDHEDARQAGEIRATLAAAVTPVGPYDVLIAGQAAARGLTLITRNLREF